LSLRWRLESYVDMLKSIDYRGRSIIACLARKEFVMPDVIKMEKAGMPVFSTPGQVADALAIMDRHQNGRTSTRLLKSKS